MSVADGTCPVCNHALRESYNDSPHTRWECTHCSWGWTEHDHDAARADGGRAEENASVKHDRGRPKGTNTQRKVNRNALRASLHERGFIGVDVTMHTRDYALVSLDDVPEPRHEVAKTYFEAWDAAYREPDATGYEWGVRI